MKPIILSLCLAFASLYCSAQEKFIEVSVQDTLLAEPDSWSVLVSIDNTSRMGELYEIELNESKTTKTPVKNTPPKGWTSNDIMKLSAKYEGSISPFKMPGAGIFPSKKQGNSDSLFKIDFNSRPMMEGFMKDISGKKDIGAFLYSTNTTKTDYYRQELYRKLLLQARAKANSIAMLSEQTVTGVMSVSESEVQTMKNWVNQAMKFVSMLGASQNGGNNSNADKVVLDNSLRVRFSVK